MRSEPTPRVTVLLPVAFPAPFLHDAIQSVLQQRFDAFELMLILNGPFSQELQHLKSQYAGENKIRFLGLPVAGIAPALNAGLERARGPYVARMDADDLCTAERLEIQTRYLDDHPETGLVACQASLLNHFGANPGMMEYLERNNRIQTWEEISANRFVESPFAHPTVMFRKKVAEQWGGYSEDPVPEDYELWLRWMDAGVKMHKLQPSCLLWRDHPGRLSRTHPHYSPEAFDQVRLTYLARWMQRNNPGKPVWVWGGGKLSVRKTRVLSAAGIPVTGFIDVHRGRTVSGYRVMHYTDIPEPGKVFILSMVTNRGKPGEIESFLQTKGYVAQRDYLMCG